MIDRAAYDTSRIDWQRLNKYAQRVARETKLPLNPALTYSKRVWTDVPVERRKDSLFGLWARTETVNVRRGVDQNIEALGAHWLLDTRHHHIEDTQKRSTIRVQETTHEYHTLALLPDGTLMKVCILETEVLNFGNVRSGLVHQEKDHTSAPPREWDITAIDFEKRYQEWGTHNGGKKSWGDREPGKRLLRHAKGVGINLALKDVLQGRSPRT